MDNLQPPGQTTNRWIPAAVPAAAVGVSSGVQELNQCLQESAETWETCAVIRREAGALSGGGAEGYRTLVENIDLGISLVNEDGTLVTANSHLGRLYRIPVEELIGKPCFVKCGTDRPCAGCPGRTALATGQPATIEKEVLLKDGETRVLSVRAFPVMNEQGKATRFIELVKDITEQRKAAQDRAHLELQLRHCLKMEALGTLAGGIAHDFNNILTAIDGYCSLIDSSIDEPERVKEYLEKLSSSSQRAAALTNGLLAYSRKQPLCSEPLDLNELIGKGAHMLARLLGEDIELVTRPAGEPAWVMADAAQLEQVLMNLSTNARDAMPRGGTLTIATGRLEMDAAFVKLHGFGEPGAWSLITVSDTGCGMDRATAQRVFEPYFTTKEVGKGTGLGLSRVYGIVKQHDGYIDVQSEPGHGTRFTIYLPSCSAPAALPLPFRPQQPRRGTETLLLVEDDREIRSALTELLEQEGYTVIAAADGGQGVREFRENRERVELAILDMVMPRMSGKDAYQEMKQLRPDLKAIFMSGYTDEVLSERGGLQPAEQFLSKPVSLPALLLKIREVLDYER